MFLLVLTNSVAFAEESAPPSLSINFGDTSSTDETCAITDDKADPVGFNPDQDQETEISFTTNCSLKIKLSILDSEDKEVLVLVDNVEKSADTYKHTWNGTTNNSDGGTFVANGTYKYEIIASDIDSGTEVDKAESDINVIIATEEETEEENSSDSDSNTEDSSSNNSSDDSSSSDDDATLALQNTQEGITSETGPGILIYGLFPVIGAVYGHKRRKKN